MKKITFRNNIVFTTTNRCKLYLFLLNMQMKTEWYVSDEEQMTCEEILNSIKIVDITKEDYKNLSETLVDNLWTSSINTHSGIGEIGFFECMQDEIDDENGNKIDLFEKNGDYIV